MPVEGAGCLWNGAWQTNVEWSLSSTVMQWVWRGLLALDTVLSGSDCFGSSVCLPVPRWQWLSGGSGAWYSGLKCLVSEWGAPGRGEAGPVPGGGGAYSGLRVEDDLQTACDLAAWQCLTLCRGEPWVTGKPPGLRPKAVFGC